MCHPEKIWIGSTYQTRRIFVLGESWYGDFSNELVTDDGYIHAYLDGRVKDAMYTRIANACKIQKAEYWQSIMFTNFVQRVGATRKSRPTTDHYKSASARLANLLVVHKPVGVWILGIGQGEYSAPIIKSAGIPYEISAHPTSYGLKNSILGSSWSAFLRKVNSSGG